MTTARTPGTGDPCCRAYHWASELGSTEMEGSWDRNQKVSDATALLEHSPDTLSLAASSFFRSSSGMTAQTNSHKLERPIHVQDSFIVREEQSEHLMSSCDP